MTGDPDKMSCAEFQAQLPELIGSGADASCASAYPELRTLPRTAFRSGDHCRGRPPTVPDCGTARRTLGSYRIGDQDRRKGRNEQGPAEHGLTDPELDDPLAWKSFGATLTNWVRRGAVVSSRQGTSRSFRQFSPSFGFGRYTHRKEQHPNLQGESAAKGRLRNFREGIGQKGLIRKESFACRQTHWGAGLPDFGEPGDESHRIDRK